MNYRETIEYLFSRIPSFENDGKSGYKPGLGTAMRLDEMTGKPHERYATIHVAGTNGKGSVCHLLAATLQQSGLKVGLYTSPHLQDFSERIRVNGVPVSQDYVCDWVERRRQEFEKLSPSFFEVTSALAFEFFADMAVDVAVIEVGLGGRLDSTNIITPQLSVITNISFDHTDLLGDTLAKIASEKAGIIKKGVPVVIGEGGDEDVRNVFREKAASVDAPIVWAEEVNVPALEVELKGDYQRKNARTAYVAVEALRRLGYEITEEDVRQAFAHFATMTGLRGRWQVIDTEPMVICDTGHNPGGFQYTSNQLRQLDCRKLHVVFGMVADKDVNTVLEMLPHDAFYYFCAPNSHRAMSVSELMSRGRGRGLNGDAFESVEKALNAALSNASSEDAVFIGGSTYVVGEALTAFKKITYKR